MHCEANMSMNASQHDLIVLVFRYLKENGFHTAADELLRHSPQEFVVGAAGISSSLVEIYNFWLKRSNNKCPSCNGGGSTTIEASSKKDKPARKPAKRKLAQPKGEKKDVKLSQTVSSTKTPTKQQNVASTGDGKDDSDSDSSLDVDKWREMLLRMTEAAKPVKKKTRKAQPKPKTDLPVKQPAENKSDILEKAMLKEHTESSPSKTATLGTETAPGPPLNGTQHLTPSNEVKTTLTPKETKKKEKKKAITPGGEQSGSPTLQHKKKKKKESSESKLEESASENGSKEKAATNPKGIESHVEIKNCSTESQDKQVAGNTIENAKEVKGKEKKAKKKEDADTQNVSDTPGKDKKSKRKKKGESDQERTAEPTDEDKEAQNRSTVDRVQVVKGTPQHGNESKKKRKRDKSNPDEKQLARDENTSIHIEEIAETTTKSKKKRQLGSLGSVPLFSLETPSPQKKKKKSKVASDEFPTAPSTA